MFQRCAVRLPRLWLRYDICPHLKVQRATVRVSSFTSEQSRKFPDSNAASKLKPWQRAFVIGIAAGFVAGQGFIFYNRGTNKDSFVTYKLVAREPVSSTASIFYLKPATTSNDFARYQDAWKNGVWNVHFKQPQIQIVRAYTPLPPLENDNTGENEFHLRFLIRHDPHGEVSSYLHRLPIGADIELRGPNLEYQLTPDVQQVVFFAGGTGIAPALQIAHALFSVEKEEEEQSRDLDKSRRLHILWASRRREDCLGGASDAPAAEPVPPKTGWTGLFMQKNKKPTPELGQQKGPIVQELENLKKKYPGQITVEYFVNEEGTWIDEDVVCRSLSRSNDKKFSTGYAASQQQRQILISGPNGFISYLAGPKEWRNGKEEQGSVSKIIAHAIAQNPHNVKVWKI